MSDNTIDYKQIELREQLDAAQQAAEKGAWAAVGHAFAKARQIAGTNSTLRKLVQDQETTTQRFRQAEMARLLAEVETLLNDDQNFAEGRIGQLLDQAQSLMPDEARIVLLRQKLNQKGAEHRERTAYEMALHECEASWSREQEMVQAQVASSEILEVCYRKAVRSAEQVAANYPDSSLLRGLVRRATIAYNQARNRYEARTTAEETGDFKSLIESLRTEKDKNKLIPWRNMRGEDQEPITVAQALSEAEILAVNFAEQKAQAYLQEATRHMANHAPRAAKQELLQSHQLFMLDDESKAVIAKFLSETIQPEISRLEEAEKVLQQASILASPEKEWEGINKALEIYPHVPNVKEIRQALLPRLADLAERQLRKARTDLSLNKLDEALSLTNEAMSYSERVVQYSADFGLLELEKRTRSLNQEAIALLAECQQEDKLVRELVDQAEKIKGLLKEQPGTAVQRWEGLIKQYGEETVARFSHLRQLRQDVETVGGIQMLKTRLEGAFASNNRTRIEKALEDMEVDVAKPQNSDYRDELVALQSKLQLRRDYLWAVVLKDKKDAEAPLTLFSRVAGQKDHPDASNAHYEVQHILNNKELETRITQALQIANDCLQEKPARSRQAYQALAAYKDEASTRKRDVDRLLGQAQQSWMTQLVERVGKELQKNTPQADKLESLIAELEELPEPRPTELLNRAKAHAAAARAVRHERAHEWVDALAQWEEALKLDVLNVSFKQGKQRTHKKVAEIRLSRLENENSETESEGVEAVKGFFLELETEMPLDPEVRFWRARYYAARAAKRGVTTAKKREYYALAEEALVATQEILVRQDVPDSILQGKIKDLQQAIALSDDLARYQQGVEQKLKDPKKRSLMEIEQARKDAQRLIAEHNQNTAVADWWQEQRDNATEQLKNANDTLEPQETWEHFAIGSRILILNPAHSLAQKFVRELPSRAEDINREIDGVINDRDALLIAEATDEKAVEIQLQKVESIQADARAIYDRLVGLREQIPQGVGAIETLANVLRTNLENLNRFLNDLEAFRQLKGRAETYLKQAKLDGKWDNFNELLRQINRAGFHNHRTANSLRNNQIAIQIRRNYLLEMEKKLKNAVEFEQFFVALNIIEGFEKPDIGDPDDSYGLRTNLQIVDPLNRSNNPITNWRVLKNLLKERQEQLETIARWLTTVGLTTILEQYNINPPPRTENDPNSFVDWKLTHKQIKSLTESGSFTNAIKLVELALDGNNNWFDVNNYLLALRPARDRLRTIPTTFEQALSQQAQNLLNATKAQYDNLILQIDQAERNLVLIKSKEQKWNEAYDNLQLAFRELDEIRRNPLTRWRKKEEIAMARQKVYEAINICSNIAPYHPVLADARNNRSL